MAPTRARSATKVRNTPPVSLDFALYTRQKADQRIFYAQFRKPEGGWTSAKSTRVIDNGRDSDRAAAIAWCQKQIDDGTIVTRHRIRFEPFAREMFQWESDWCEDRRLLGRRISKEQIERHAEIAENHLYPAFGELRLADIDDERIRQWRLGMSRKLNREGEKLTGATINRASVTLRLVMKEAVRKKLIRALPPIPAVTERPKRRGTFTPPEIRALFSKPWPDARCMIANRLAVSTGLRASEIVGLQERHVHPEYLDIEQGWTPGVGLHAPKNGKTRIVPIHPIIFRALRTLLKENPYPASPDRFIFWSASSDRPIDQRLATEALYARLKDIGISESARKTRRLDLHAWRHTFNSLLINRRVPQQMVQDVVGHLSPEMTQRYYHLGADDMDPVRAVQDELLGIQKRARTRIDGKAKNG